MKIFIYVRGYKEKGSVTTPRGLAIDNQVDRFNLVIDVIDRVRKLGSAAVYVRERMKADHYILRDLT